MVEFLERNLSSASDRKQTITVFNHNKAEIIGVLEQGDKIRKMMESKKYVIILECSAGNDTVGDMWLETHICNSKTTIEEIIEWKNSRRGGKGKLIITEPSNINKIKIIK